MFRLMSTQCVLRGVDMLFKCKTMCFYVGFDVVLNHSWVTVNADRNVARSEARPARAGLPA